MRLVLFLIVGVLFLPGCRSAYYSTLESVGIHKRDLMVDRVEDARDAQEATKQQFQSALQQFTSVVKVKGGSLEKKYEKLKDAYEESKDKTDIVRKRIESVENVSRPGRLQRSGFVSEA